MRKLFKALTTVAATALAGGTLVAGFASTADAATVPPWEVVQAPATNPAVFPNEAGGLTFYNSSGQVITGGNITDNPIAAYIQGNTALQPAPTLVDLNGYDPTTSGAPVPAPGNWSGVGLGSSNLPSSAPGALGSSTLPVYTGQNLTLSQLTETLPNTDTSTTDGYAGIYVLRLFTFQHTDGGTSTTYDSADISVNSSTGAWTLVYAPQAATTTTLETPTPASPQTAGTSVTLTANVTDASAPGTVQFESNGAPVGSPQPVTNGTATLVTTALPSGTDSLTAVYTPTTGAAFTGSTSTNPVSYVVNAPPAHPTSTALNFTSPANQGAPDSVSATVTDTSTSSPLTSGAGSIAVYDFGSTNPGSPVTSFSGASLLGTAQLGSGGTATLSPAPSFTSSGTHYLVAQFTPANPAGVLPTYTGSVSSADPLTVNPNLLTGNQDIEAGIPTGTLLLTTPYNAGNPFNLGTAILDPTSSFFIASGSYGTAAGNGTQDPVTITDTRAGDLGWTASASVTNFVSTTNSGDTINAQNLSFTGVVPSYIGGDALQAGSVTVDQLTSGHVYAAGASGSDGLAGSGKPFASAAVGDSVGSVNVDGTLTLKAPTSTPAGLYAATLTFTVA
ncbi:MAG: Ig-like domain-containing protein [Acidimicrobiales bacterium]